MRFLVPLALLSTLTLVCAGHIDAQTSGYAAQLPIEGYSQPNRLANVAAATSGILKEKSIPEGSAVSQGDCLVRLDSTIHREILAIAKLAKDSTGETNRAEAEFEAQKTRLQRIEALASRQHASEVELLQAREQLALAQAGLLAANERQLQRQAEYQKLSAEAKLYCVKAPFDGVIVEFTKETGEYVGPADPNVCVVAELSQLSVEFLVPRTRRAEIKHDGTANVLFVDSNETVEGTVIYVSPYPNGETNLYTVKVRVDNADRHLDAGVRCQLLDVRAPSPRHDVQAADPPNSSDVPVGNRLSFFNRTGK